jgi:hypothetical protein
MDRRGMFIRAITRRFSFSKGEVAFQIGDKKSWRDRALFFKGRAAIPHTFKNNGKTPARMLVFVMPAGLKNFVKEFAQPVPSFDSPAIPVTPQEIEKLLATAPKYGFEILPPPAGA